MMKEIATHHTGFYELFEPTAELVYEAVHERKGTEISAILQSIFLIEAAANCCLFGLEINNKLRSELDRLPVFAKFDLYLLIRSRGSITLDRGSSFFQDIAELIRFGNTIAHPKINKVNWVVQDDEFESSIGSYDISERLKISTTCTAWSAQDSVILFKAVNKFIEYFFAEVCELTEQEIRLLLLTVKGDDTEDIWVNSQRLMILQDEYSIPLSLWGVGHNN